MTLACTPKAPFNVAVSATSVYWSVVDLQTGTVVTTSK